LLGGGEKGFETGYGEKKNYLVLGRLEQPRQYNNLLYRHEEFNEPTLEGPLSCVLFDSIFASVSTVSRSHPSLVYREVTIFFNKGTVQPD